MCRNPRNNHARKKHFRELVSHKNPHNRIESARILGELGGSDSERALLKALSDPDRQVRCQVIQSLGKIQSKTAVPVLVEILENQKEDTLVRSAAANAMGLIMDPTAVDPLISAAYEGQGIGFAAVEALGFIADVRAVAPLIHLLKSTLPGGSICQAIAISLAEIGDPKAIIPLLETASRTFGSEFGGRDFHACMNSLTKLSRRSIQPLVEALHHPEERVRRFSAETLGSSGNPRAISPLIETLKDDGDGGYIKNTAVQSLVCFGNEAVEYLIDALEDAHRECRLGAAEALGKIGDPGAVRGLLAVMEHDPDPWVRGRAAAALGKIGHPSAIQPIAEALKHDPAVKYSGIKALGQFKDTRVVNALLEYLDHEDQEVRLAAIRALNDIGDPKAIQPLLLVKQGKDDFECFVIDNTLDNLRKKTSR